jgi:thiamine pyrophosphate-dependent acetolactate synthase large subunit-like protein
MIDRKVYHALAEAFIAEGIGAHFTLMGDGNMHWATILAAEYGLRTIHARHEHSAVAMAMAYSRATDTVGVASVTMGPGFTQIITALTSAARNEVPLVVFAGDSPTTNRWYHQRFDQASVALSTGAHFIPVRSPERAVDCVAEAFYVARREKRPVVLSTPLDIQKQALASSPYLPSSSMIPGSRPVRPDELGIAELAALIFHAERPIFIAGRGAMAAGAGGAIEQLAEHCGALLSTTLPARGLFDHDPYSLGIAGGFSSDIAREQFARSDLVVAFGASLGQHTQDGGKLYPQAKAVQVDARPRGLHHGMRVSDLHVTGDARLAAEALIERMKQLSPSRKGWRNAQLALALADFRDRAWFEIEPDVLDPREAIRAMDAVIPKDWAIVGASGHSFYFSATHVRGRSPHDFFTFKEFGEIGSHLCYAIGVAVARGDGKVAVIDGDGSLMMNIQELETVQRHGLRLLIVALNDGAFGAELHKLRVEKHHPEHAVFGRPDYESIARGFGLRGATVTRASQFPEIFERHLSGNNAEMWNVHISQNVVSPPYRRRHRIPVVPEPGN